MNTRQEKVITRFAPSPTGFLHMGSARTALFNFVFARQYGGKFILRIEDTDKERSKKEYEQDILDGLAWLCISYDEIYRQSERAEIHKKYLQKMIDAGTAYEAEEGKNGGGKVIRFKNPGERVGFRDMIRGDIDFDTTELGDFVIAKDINTPLFHLAVVVDDLEMGVTHIIRGEDHISNTPRQILIQRAINAPEPKYAHLPLILAPDRSKLSKRHGAVSVTDFRKHGYLPEAIVNFLALLGWNPGDEREILTMNDIIKEFSFEHVQKGGAIFNTEKLDWVNKEHTKHLSNEEINFAIKSRLPQISDAMIVKVRPIVLDHINKFGDIDALAQAGEWDYFFAKPQYEKEKLFWKDETDPIKTRTRIEKVIYILQEISPEDLTAEKAKEAIWNYASEEGRGSVLWPMRYALSGRDKSPDPFTLVSILGKEETINRLKEAAKKLA